MRKILTIGFILILTLSFTSILRAFSTPATPKIYVEPKQNIFSPDTTSVGDTFTINISTSGWEDPGLFSFQFELHFDPTLLSVEKADYPANLFLPPPNFPVPIDPSTYEKGYVLFGVTKLGVVPGSTGGGGLGYITFKIIKAPPPLLSCNLELKEITFLDPDGTEYTEYEVEDGFYEFSPPKSPVYLKVEPATVSAAQVGDEVSLSVTINEMQSALKIANATFKLQYNTTLLSTQQEWITPGGTYPSFTATVEADYVKVEVQMVTGEPFPEGKATLATIKFNATYLPPTLTTSPLHLIDVALKDIDGSDVQYDRLEDGLYKVPITAEKEDLNADGKVNIEDLYVFAQDFGSYPGHARWHDGRADMDGNGRVNVVDAVLIAMKFHG